MRAARCDVSLTPQNGGDVLVEETQQIVFQGGPFTQGYRSIPLDRMTGIDGIVVSEPSQVYRQGRDAPYTFATSRTGDGKLLIEWWFPQTTGATRTFTVRYLARGAVRFYSGGDQLRWTAIGDDRPYPVDQVHVMVRLPFSVRDAEWMVAAYPDRLNRAGSATASGDTATWQLPGLDSNQAYEIRAQWPHGIITGTPPPWQAAADIADERREAAGPVLTLAFEALGIIVPVFGVLWVVLLWYGYGRDPQMGKVPAELTEPPSDLPPGVAGMLVDERADVQDVIATVLDLAARGIIGIREIHDPALSGTGRDFELVLLQEDKIARPAAKGRDAITIATDPVERFEQVVLFSLFPRENEVRLSQVGN